MQNLSKKIGYFLGPLVFLLILSLPLPPGMKPEALKVAAVTVLMAIWWITEAIPIPATSLLPIALFPALGIMKSASATAPYANHLIFLFMGGFFLAVTMERWNLHRRVALHTINFVGGTPGRIVLGFMLATAFLSMWVSNTATTMMMVPIGLAVITQATGLESGDLKACPSATSAEYNFGKCLMLGIAYAASIGGVATIIGTPPNTVMVGMVDKMYGQTITFGQWMAVGVPLAAIMLVFSWLLLTRVLFPMQAGSISGGRAVIRAELAKLGTMRYEEKVIVGVGAVVATCWIARGFVKGIIPGIGLIHDATIGIAGALLLFAIPAKSEKGFILNWQTAVRIPWDVILLFGGGLALANGFKTSELAGWIAQQLTVMQGSSLVLFIGVVVLLTIFLTEITSNTATATLLVPIMGSAAVAMGSHPFGPIVAACVSASFAFMLPVATPPNAVIFGSGCVTIPQMCKAGFWLNLFGAALITLFVVVLVPLLWNIDLSVVPTWAHMVK